MEMTRYQSWILAIRCKTLSASMCPVLLGSVFAIKKDFFSFPIFLETLSFALLIQIGTNLSNDYFDFTQGSDTSERKGPVRACQQGLISSQHMMLGFCLTFFLAFLMSLHLIWIGGFWFFLGMVMSILSGIFYTATKYSLASLGLGDLFVFLFFGPVAVLGTYYLQMQDFGSEILSASLGAGFICTAILAVNNIRDVEEDTKSHKKTLVVRLGKKFGKSEYLFCLITASIMPFFIYKSFFSAILLTFAALFISIPLIMRVFREDHLNASLEDTAKFLILYTALICAGVLIS